MGQGLVCSEIEHLITLVSVGCHHFTFDDFVPFIHQSVGANNTYYLVKTSSPNLANDKDSHLCCMLHSILPPSTFVCISMETLILLHSCDNLFWCHCGLCSLIMHHTDTVHVFKSVYFPERLLVLQTVFTSRKQMLSLHVDVKTIFPYFQISTDTG